MSIGRKIKPLLGDENFDQIDWGFLKEVADKVRQGVDTAYQSYATIIIWKFHIITWTSLIADIAFDNVRYTGIWKLPRLHLDYSPAGLAFGARLSIAMT